MHTEYEHVRQTDLRADKNNSSFVVTMVPFIEIHK